MSTTRRGMIGALAASGATLASTALAVPDTLDLATVKKDTDVACLYHCDFGDPQHFSAMLQNMNNHYSAYAFDSFKLDIKTAGSIGWIPYAASGVGCLAGGALSSWLLRRGVSVNMSRKVALGASAALMPWVMLVPQLHSVGWVIFIFSVAFFGQQSWSTLVMILPTDLIDRRAVGTLAGLVGFGGAMGGVLLGQIVGYLRDQGHSYAPALFISGSLHLIAFAVICLGIPRIKALDLSANTRA